MSDIVDLLVNYLDGQETAKHIETCLTTLIQKTLQDPHYRQVIQQGSRKEFWICFSPVIKKMTEKDCLVNLIKFARNIVAGDLNNQQLALQYGALKSIQNRLEIEAYDQTMDNSLLLQVSTQAICNMITNHSMAIDVVWQEWMLNGSIWSDILSKNNDNLITSVLVLMINCIRGNKQRCDLMIENGNGRKILGLIVDDLERLHSNEESKSFELGYTIFNEMFLFGYFKQLYTLFKDNLSVLSTRQTILFKLLDSKIHTYKDTLPTFINDRDLEFLCEQFELIAKETVRVILDVKESSSEDLQVEQVSNIYTAIILLFQILNQLLILEAKGLKQSLAHINVISLTLDILGHLRTINLPPAQADHPELGFNFLKRECVRMIGAMCHEDKKIQDEIRELGGIPLILEQFKIDDSNPYLREYATLALRNIMKDNIENQEVIRELEPQEVLQTDELDRMGITPELLKDGKIRIKRTEL
ncbi:hypothetical protein G6F57_009073 [Rhizopus arrhizus]|nr:hypothetical protein G6F24_008150 [Rhizopus arrhizus]KAG1416933.1 hypothetical protein G6F58_005736 [Rhizopus delemar]KAG0789426.1 hypothetical protein G6F21_006519 [Rhizopus arrhizus]KAG0798204.1 hypothetical protein G6F22_004455 [Rhizopus arrhizus]KAG0809660.1 hypothetical protein G6F20_008600 [Rhizopus arrhizus]